MLPAAELPGRDPCRASTAKQGCIFFRLVHADDNSMLVKVLARVGGHDAGDPRPEVDVLDLEREGGGDVIEGAGEVGAEADAREVAARQLLPLAWRELLAGPERVERRVVGSQARGREGTDHRERVAEEGGEVLGGEADDVGGGAGGLFRGQAPPLLAPLPQLLRLRLDALGDGRQGLLHVWAAVGVVAVKREAGGVEGRGAGVGGAERSLQLGARALLEESELLLLEL
mmetsp:Transcript_33453/g.78933  ORF Transcript_33453/g.78933 Transcript_33453/m.78933 type:complete len:229 (+) Transcript_33453:388-1074(+)